MKMERFPSLLGQMTNMDMNNELSHDTKQKLSKQTRLILPHLLPVCDRYRSKEKKKVDENFIAFMTSSNVYRFRVYRL